MQVNWQACQSKSTAKKVSWRWRSTANLVLKVTKVSQVQKVGENFREELAWVKTWGHGGHNVFRELPIFQFLFYFINI